MSQADWITSALVAVRSAGLNGRDLRQAQWQIFETAKGTSASEPRDGHDVRCEMENIAASVGKAAGHVGRMLPHQASKWLRDAGAPLLASRLTKLKRGRNVLSHPDIELSGEVQSFLANYKGPDGAANSQPRHTTINLTGSWSSIDHQSIEVLLLPSGPYVSFDAELHNLTKIMVNGSCVEVNGYELKHHTGNMVRWVRPASDLLPEQEVCWHPKATCGEDDDENINTATTADTE